MVDDLEDVSETEEDLSESDFRNYSTAILVLGIVITIGIIGIKVAAMAQGGTIELLGLEIPDKIYTGGEHFSTYFFSGLIVGILVIIIGIAISAQSKEKVIEEETFTEEAWKEEEEEGICPTCGAVIPIESEICPECGEELAPPEEEQIEEEEEEEIEEVEVFECPICGAEVPTEAEECPECGEPLTDLEEEEEALFDDL